MSAARYLETAMAFFGYDCPRCGNTTWLKDEPEKFLYCAHCDNDSGDLTCTKKYTTLGIVMVEEGPGLLPVEQAG